MKFAYILIFSLLTFNLSFGQTNRTLDGSNNNLTNLQWGATGAAQLTKTSNGFKDGYSTPGGESRENPRIISNTIFDQEVSIPDHIGLSDYNFVWGQFIDHDITLVLDGENDPMHIDVPKYDPWMDPLGGGNAKIPLTRSGMVEGTGTELGNERKYPNAITSFIDASTIYGSDKTKSDWLRTFENGKLKSSTGNLLPYNTLNGEKSGEIDPEAPEMAMLPGTDKFYVAGDLRANENVLLTSMHTVFMREHNRICDELLSNDPDLLDEALFQRARKMVGAIIQSIVYNEWLPTIGILLNDYPGYSDKINPQIYNVFSAAAYRYGHTTINSKIYRMDNYANDMGEDQMTLKDAFFSPYRIDEMNGIDPFIKGMCMQQEQEFDCKMIDDLRNFLFGPPGAGGMDLAAINIQRGRERGLPDYNTIRANFNLTKYTDFNQISDNYDLTSQLYNIYGSIDNIDPWVGMLAEKHVSNSLFGSLVQKIMTNQFSDLRIGDRYYYLNDPEFSSAERNIISNTRLSDVIIRNTGVYSVPNEIFRAESKDFTIRSIDGINNNSIAPEWGAVGSELRQVVSLAFEDGMGQPAGQDRPNAREISNNIFQQDELENDPNALSDYNFVWGQFIDHDVTLVLDDSEESFNISIPINDPYFDPNGTGNEFIPLYRSNHSPNSGLDPSNPRRFPNSITAYMDGSNVYGSNKAVSEWLRAFENGKLKTSEGNMLPYNTITGEKDAPIDPNVPQMAIFHGTDKYFVAGDLRANENVLLTSIHTLFMREHNRLCDELIETHPNWNDEQLYQHARRIVGAKIQSISYNEWIPTMGLSLTPYEGYDPDMKAQIYNSFSAAIFRYGHSIINSKILRLYDDGTATEEGPIHLKEAFFNPELLYTTGDIDPYLKGMTAQVEQNLDCKMIDDLRNFLFGPPGAGGMDLAAINIQRGRERGLADYNSIRSEMGLTAKTSFDEISSDPTLNQNLSNTYNSIDKIDLWVGTLAEDHLPNSIFGELSSSILSQQFQSLRDGDRFFFENDRMLSDLEKITIRNTKLHDIIKRNTQLTNIPDLVFIAELQPDAVELVAADNITLSVYPNPASSSINIQLASQLNGKAVMELSNLFGQVLISKEIQITNGLQDINMNLDQFVTGVYIVNIHTENGLVSTKFIKL